MSQIIQSSLGGSVAHAGANRYVCTYRGRFISFLLSLLVVFWALGTAFMFLALFMGEAPLGVLGGAALGAVATAGAAWLLRFRLRTMGRCVIDGDARTLSRLGRGDSVASTWSLAEIRFEKRWDPVHRGFGLHYWLIARTPEGLGLRLAKGLRDEVDALMQRFAALQS